MAPLLSGNTLGLKFMQRGAAAKAATEGRKQEDTTKQAQVTRQAAMPKQDSSEEEGSSDSDSDSEDASAAPLASTSKLPTRVQSSITTESSYLAFPILSAAYGVASPSSETVPNSVNGRFTFGKQPKPKKSVTKEEDPSSGSDSDEPDRKVTSDKKKGKTPKLTSISGGGRGYSAMPSIREQKKARAAAEAERNDSAEPAYDYEEDTNFVDDMMQKARQKRQLDGGQKSRPKKRKSDTGIH
ncbi:hypothetical protein P389DRAFT_18415 [Cystobasidium minutum MCA 4210]|uniref:uncharacterized protein n=1 Tax=Cystobasidium minutum MCA 4210 TaxID=1397322 RepID=UPI0034CE1CBF|eukprot:jgi/Rhomi1/18415/CE18414_346